MANQVSTPMANQVSLKLLVNKEKNRVFLAEAGKDFVDVLFSFLTLPLGTVARLTSKESSIPPVRVGCLASLYESVAKLDGQCFPTEDCKEALLRPKNSSDGYCRSVKLNIDDTEPAKYFLCEGFRSCTYRRLSNFRIKCDCGKFFTNEVWLKNERVFEGFVKDGATFIITDDLIVTPNSMDAKFSTLDLLWSYDADINSAQQVTVNVSHNKVLDLLKCSLLSKCSLTDFFLGKEPLLVSTRFPRCDVATQSHSIKINVRLMMRKSDGKILYAEGEEDFADFLFGFLTLPLGAVVNLLKGRSSVGSIDALHKSIVDLNEKKYFISDELKNRLVSPRLAPQLVNQKFPIDESYVSKYYPFYPDLDLDNFDVEDFLEGSFYHVTTQSRDCNTDEESMSFLYTKSQAGSPQGYVKGPTMYVATDDLVVAPMSPVLVISLLKRFNVPRADLTVKAITIGINEGLSILEASLTSTSALTNGLSHLITKVKEEK